MLTYHLHNGFTPTCFVNNDEDSIARSIFYDIATKFKEFYIIIRKT